MITVKLSSRMGNQLFQYAFAYSMSRRLNTFFLIDTAAAKHGYIIRRYFDLSRMDSFFSALLLRPYRILSRIGIVRRMEQTNFMQPKDFILSASNHVEYSGY